MKNAQMSQGLFIALLLAASAVSAQDYPAANFQPKIVYQDQAIVEQAQSKPASVGSAEAPCASKEGKVEVQAEFDAKYPAASFQPKVIFSN